MVLEAVGTALAIAGGHVGNRVGKSKLTGSKPWNKVLAPAAALATGIAFKKITGQHMDVETTMQAGSAIGGQAILYYTVAKNGLQFFKSLIRKD